MDFLDSIELDAAYKKSHRVRSWYLYEQFRALERHQIDAAQKLKDKTYQDKILYQELSERRARRMLSDQFSACQSESGIERIRSQSQCINSSSEDFLECFCDVHDDEDIVSQGTARDVGYMDDDISQDESQPDQQFEYNKSLEDLRDDRSGSASVNSVVDNFKSNQNLADDIKEELECVKKNIAENISLQLSTVQDDMDCLETFTAMCEDDKLSSKCDGDESEYSIEYTTSVCKKSCDYDSNLYSMWSKLVSFAYQVTQLNHGNCYYDYSSQFLTAVLACDVLRRGVTRMCDILQPYVCPIKFATDTEVSDTSESHKTHKYAKRKCICGKKSKKSSGPKFLPLCHCRKRITSVRTCVTEIPVNYSATRTKRNKAVQRWGKYSCDNRLNASKLRFDSESRPSFDNPVSNRIQPSAISSSSIFQEAQGKLSDCNCRVINPMLMVGSYIDSLLKEVDDS